MTDIQARLRDWKYGDNGTHKIAHALRMKAADHIEKIEAENAELRGVLAWYGDEGKYDRKEIFDILVGPKTPIENDGGQRARDSIGQREVKDAE